MTTGVVKTQGTRLFFQSALGSPSAIYSVACATAITGLGGPKDQIPIDCLSSLVHEFEPGLDNPGQVNVPFNFIPTSASQQALIALKESGEKVSWMIVSPSQTGSPTTLAADSDGVFHLVSPGATTLEWIAYVADLNFDIATNEIWRNTMVLQRSSVIDYDLPAATQP